MSSTRFLVLTSLALGLSMQSHSVRAETTRPNVVLIYADDMGYGDPSCFGGKLVETPNIDRIAREGRKFTNFHVAQPVCSASRTALLTGCYPNRLGIHGALGPRSRNGIADRETTIAEMLKANGYSTGIAGKWHLGHLPRFLPTRHGFDEYLGLPYSNDMWPYHPNGKRANYPDLPLIEQDRIIDADVDAEDQKLLTKRYTARAVSFIQKHKDQPFFFYLPFAMPHVPLFVSPEFQGKSGKGTYGDVLLEIDWAVGQVLKTLDDQNLASKTLVIFTSDNGPWLSYGTHGGSAGPLREGKGTCWEGGVRVPCVMRFPGELPAGTTSNAMLMTIDLLPTIQAITGANAPPLPIDGRNVWPLIKGEPGAENPHDFYYFYYETNQLQAVTSGDGCWKLMLPHRYRTLTGGKGGEGGKPAAYQTRNIERPELYDLESDLSESTDVAGGHPEIVKRLFAAAETAREDLGDSLQNRTGKNRRDVNLTDFNSHFLDESLRVDYQHGGDAKTEWALIDRLYRGGIWAGSRVHLQEVNNVGRSIVELWSPDGKDRLYSRRFDTYFGEYATTAAAEKGVKRSYHESAIVPFPREKIRFVLKSERVPGKILTLLDVELDPKSLEISRESIHGAKVLPIHRGGDPHQSVDVAILAEGYTLADESKLKRDLERYKEVFFSQEPFKSARSRFNLMGVWKPSAESGCDEPSRGLWKETAIGATFDSLGSERYMLTEENKALRDIASVVPYDTIYIMVNHPRYGGGGIYNLFCTFSSDNLWSPYIFLHEFGHSFAGLGDEYYTSSVSYNDFYPKGTEPDAPNITALLNKKTLKWGPLATQGVTLPTPWNKARYDELDTAFQKKREALNAKIAELMRAKASPKIIAELNAELESLSVSNSKSLDELLQRDPNRNLVGAFEGAGYASQGLYRPAIDCIMFSKGTKPFCPVCRRAIERVIEQHGE